MADVPPPHLRANQNQPRDWGAFNDISTASGSDAEIDELLQFLKEMEQRERAAAAGKYEGKTLIKRYHDGVGAFMVPDQYSWAAHRTLVLDPELKLGYNPDRYGFFDGIIHREASLNPLHDNSHRLYPVYDVLRENLAIVRNFALCELFDNYQPERHDFDARNAKRLATMADTIVKGLNNHGLLRNPLAISIDPEKANLPGSGAQYIYSKLLEVQTNRNWISQATNFVTALVGASGDYQWDLPALEDSPFSDARLAMPPPSPGAAVSDAMILEALAKVDRAQIDPVPQQVSEQTEMQLHQIADEFMLAGSLQYGLDRLDEPTRRESIEIAKDILEKLKLKLGLANLAEGLKLPQEDAVSVLGALKSVVNVYQFHLHKLAGLDPQIYDNPAIVAANQSIGLLSYVAKAETLAVANKRGDSAMAEAIGKDMQSLPQSWRPDGSQSLGQTLDNLSSGLKTVLTRINQTEQRDPSTAQWLGFSSQKALGNQQHTPTTGNTAPSAQSQKMKEVEFFRQLQAQRSMRARQAATRHSMRQQQMQAQQRMDDAPKKPALDTLIAPDQLSSLRSTMNAPADMPTMNPVDRSAQQMLAQQQRQQAQRQAKRAEETKRRQDQQKPDDNKQPAFKRKDKGISY